METHASHPSSANEVQRQISRCCDEFERAWKNGGTPRLEEFQDKVSPADRTQLLRELLILELKYRRDDADTTLSDARLCELHPELMPEIADQLKLLHDRQWGLSDDDGLTQRQSATPKDNPTIALESRSSSGSRGLHIRCPHCSNPVELLTDTPLESITCRTCGSAFSLVGDDNQTREAPTLKRIGRFELVSRIGIGGFGTVWKARDTELERTVAVKIPRKGQLARSEVEQFLREARSAAQLRHPHIVPVHEVGREEDTVFIVSDYVRGVSLTDWFSGATPTPRESARLLAKIADAVQHAHEKGIIHRDLKPSNILMDEFGQPHLLDFGLAKRELGEISMTMDGQVLGTPAFMSPEQARGQSHWTDRRTDVYSLGVVMFKMLTGELPFRGNAQMQIHKRLTEDPPDPRSLNRFVPRDLSTICLKCLERDPNRRFSTAQELFNELRRFDRGEPIRSRPISRTERAMRWAKRKPALATAAALTVLLAVVGPIVAAVIYGQRNRLEMLLVERDNIIDSFTEGKEDDSNTIAELRDALDLWEGRANPWEFWPPRPELGPRAILLSEVAGDSRRRAAWQQTDDKEPQAYGYLALAIMNDELGRTDEAVKNYRAARDQLTQLAAQEPASVQYGAALTDCYRQLSRLQSPTDPAAAAKDLEQGRTMTRQLATEHGDPRLYAEWLEAELDTAIATTAENRSRNLDRTQQIKSDFAKKVSNDPVELYQLACFLSGREPILMTRKPNGGKNAAAEPANE